jgi:hypothetical protein
MTARPPISSDIVCEERDSGVTFHIAPVDFRRAGGSLQGWGIRMGFTFAGAAFAGVITLALLVGFLLSSHRTSFSSGVGWSGLIGILCLRLIPALFFLVGWHAGNTRTTLDLRNGILSIDQTGPWRSRHLEFKGEEIYAIYQGLPECSASEGPPPDTPVLIVTSIKDQPRRILVIQPDRDCQARLLAGRTQQEIEWIAEALKQALDSPPPRPMTLWQWLRRNSPR